MYHHKGKVDGKYSFHKSNIIFHNNSSFLCVTLPCSKGLVGLDSFLFGVSENKNSAYPISKIWKIIHLLKSFGRNQIHYYDLLVCPMFVNKL